MTGRKLAIALASLALVHCDTDRFGDLDRFMAEKRARPSGALEPVPPFLSQPAFAYGASALRTPFGRPNGLGNYAHLQSAVAAPPDFQRPSELLEQYAIAALNMVGSLSLEGRDWSLIEDPLGGVHRVRVGHYLGHNHGRVVEITGTHVVAIEVIADGNDGWVQRPRMIELRGP